MDQLTNLYKHKCEQFQEQVNYLTRKLNEGKDEIIRAALEAAERAAAQVPERVAMAAERAAAHAAAEAAAHAALVKITMGTLMHDLRMLPFGSWLDVWEIFTAIEKEAFIALFGSQTPVVLEGTLAGVPAQFIRYRTPNGEWAVMYNHAMPIPGGGSNGHSNWISLTKGNTPFGHINSQGFLEIPRQVLSNTPEHIFVPPPISTTPSRGSIIIGGGGLGQSTGNPG